jgi:hypothetical protein
MKARAYIHIICVLEGLDRTADDDLDPLR